jgi:peptidoglycan/LPS O-acetylase OafA/YrhL
MEAPRLALHANMPRVTPGGRFYLPQLDGLRFCAFLIVFLSHGTQAVAHRPTGLVHWYHPAWWGQSALLAGSFGVELFFVLSSYLITTLLLREVDARGRIDVPAFWLRRVLRIWPLYLGVLFAYALLVGVPARLLVAFALFAGNWGMAAWPGMPTALYPLWSVSVEEQFYLAWPLVLSAVPRRHLRVTAAALIVAAVVTRAGLFASGVNVSAVWLNTATHLDAIGVGALVALGGQVRLVPAARRLLAVASVLTLVVCAGTVWHGLLQPAPADVPLYAGAGASVWASLAFLAASLACGGVLVAVLAAEGSWLSHPALVYLGRISYGLYVYHGLALGMTDSWVWPTASAFAVTLVAAAVSYHVYELPFLRLKRRFERVSFVSDLHHTPVSAGVRVP